MKYVRKSMTSDMQITLQKTIDVQEDLVRMILFLGLVQPDFQLGWLRSNLMHQKIKTNFILQVFQGLVVLY